MDGERVCHPALLCQPFSPVCRMPPTLIADNARIREGKRANGKSIRHRDGRVVGARIMKSAQGELRFGNGLGARSGGLRSVPTEASVTDSGDRNSEAASTRDCPCDDSGAWYVRLPFEILP